ncbi:hypothetical protein I601_1631 [Nocardioides dokdonensis FR1436]|uniref:Galactosyltransferase C-terminal domain-containing protein n=1 Tax=Nocardioides dokdonensis FR1436 TaxID=1300347 RepID=A0A1A9GKE3_9ACTN|nr:galactosyltransferase-related protein [Nocardioides dokdonensis]ANH38063.1 hypothetical protein I601_1631 [Nocardioides dokdonensis FR1436]
MSGTAVVTIAHGRHDHLARQRASLGLGDLLPDLTVVVAMDDDPPVPHLAGVETRVLHLPTAPLGLPLARARNQGVAEAVRLGADVLVLLDVDLLAGPGLVAAYADVVRREPVALWSGPVTYLPPPPTSGYDLRRLDALDAPHPARPAPLPGEVLREASPDLFWSLSFATSATGWRRVGGFCEEYVGYGGEDTDFARLAVSREVPLGWVGAARGFHQHHPTQDPPRQHLDDVLRNAALFHRRWGRWPMTGWLQAFEAEGLVTHQDGRWTRV